MQKIQLTTSGLLSLTLALCGCTSAPELSENAPVVYLNPSVGYDANGYQYAQAEFPCSIDEYLVEKISEQAAHRGIKIIETTSHHDLENSDNLLAIDITDLPNTKSHVYVGSKSTQPKLALSAVFLDRSSADLDIQKKEESCSGTITYNSQPLSESRAGSANTSLITNFCSEMRKCGKQLSKDLSKWLEAHITPNRISKL